MRCSIWPTLQQPWGDVAAVVGHADLTGWHCCYLADHFMGDGASFGDPGTPTLEGTAGIAALASSTERIRLGTLVLGNTYRHPAVVANWAATVDHISGGRLTLGLGAGWQVNEHEQYGIELPPPGVRVSRFEEACTAIRSLLRDPVTDLDGDHYRLTRAVAEPQPVQQPLPLLIGGKGDRMLGIVARLADAWNMWGLPTVIAERGLVLDQRCERIGRDPSEISRSTQALFCVTDDEAAATAFVDSVSPRAAVAGPASRLREVVAEWAAVGIDEVIVPDWTLGRGAERFETMDLLRTEVMI